jgi:hypothetical protein
MNKILGLVAAAAGVVVLLWFTMRGKASELDVSILEEENGEYKVKEVPESEAPTETIDIESLKFQSIEEWAAKHPGETYPYVEELPVSWRESLFPEYEPEIDIQKEELKEEMARGVATIPVYSTAVTVGGAPAGSVGNYYDMSASRQQTALAIAPSGLPSAETYEEMSAEERRAVRDAMRAGLYD